jgi:hypothetical protein
LCNTVNKKQHVHSYTLTIPKKVPQYTIDVVTVDKNGNIIPPGTTVMQDQEIPTIDIFKSYFNDYVKNYILYNNFTSLSYTNISDYWYGDVNNVDLNINIDVIYYKSHIPYPIPLSLNSQFEQKYKKLEERNAELCFNVDNIILMYQKKQDQYNAFRDKFHIAQMNTEEKHRIILEKMQKKFREIYSQCNSTENCPVCYESIHSDKLKVPGCCHTICTDCSEKCVKCPICREVY